MKRPSLRSFFHALLGSALFAAGSAQGQSTITAWDFSGVTGYGASPLAPNTANSNLTIVGLTRGSGLTTTPTAASNAWGSNGWNGPTNAASAVSANKFVTFTVTPNTGYTLSLSSIGAYNVRRSTTGPGSGLWQYSLDGTTFTDIGTTISYPLTTSGGNSMPAIDLSGISALQNVPDSTTVTFRLVNWGASNATGTWYFNNVTGTTDLSLTGTVVSGGGPDVTPPTVSTLAPTDGATGVGLSVSPEITFSETVQKIAGSGSIELRKADTTLVQSFGIDDLEVSVVDNKLTINPTANLDYSTSYYIVFVPTSPATALVEDLAGNDFTGLTTATDWEFTTEAPPPPPPVVINKYFNGTTDLVEILVIGNGVTGTTWDLRGMILKDFSTDGSGDGGGAYQFTTNTLWSAVPVGTLITLRNAATTTDTTVNAGSGDFNLDVGLSNTTYFSSVGGTFNIAGQEIVMLKASGSPVAGNTGGIHAFAATTGTPSPTFFDSFSGPKLLSSLTTPAGAVAFAQNSTSLVADFNGTDATVVTTSLPLFGQPNNATNATYIYGLRGVSPGDGSGFASALNATVSSPFNGVNVFAAGQSASQSVGIVVTGVLGGDTIETVRIIVPSNFGLPSATVGVAGAGAGTPVASVTGDTVTVSGLAVTSSDSVTITLNGLDTPATTSSDTGLFPFTVQTAKAGGTPTSIAAPPPVRVVIPIEAIRDVNVNGVPADLNTVVAVEGICTEGNLNASSTLAFLQQGNFGVGVFNGGLTTTFVRGKRYVVLGTVSQFNGLTQIAFSSGTDVFDLGTDTEPAPLTIDIPTLLGSPETYEGRLIKITGLSRDPSDTDIWATGATILMTDGASPTPNTLNAAISSGSGATTPPVGVVNITGIFTQNDTTSPFDTAYRISPREASDLESVGSGYSVWIDGFYPGETDPLIIGPNADPDGDGISNLVEAFTATEPDVGNGAPIYGVTKSANTVVFFINQPKSPVSGLTGSYEWSTGLGSWNASGDTEGGVTVSIAEVFWDDTNPNFDQYQVTATITAGTPDELFVRLVVED